MLPFLVNQVINIFGLNTPISSFVHSEFWFITSSHSPEVMVSILFEIHNTVLSVVNYTTVFREVLRRNSQGDKGGKKAS